jgi:hypothetical protein
MQGGRKEGTIKLRKQTAVSLDLNIANRDVPVWFSGFKEPERPALEVHP